MGLAAGVAIVSATDVAQITQEPALASLDQGSDATQANALVQATNAIMRALRIRGVDPAKVDSTDDLKAAASWWIAWRKFDAMPAGGINGDLNARKAKNYKQLFDDEIASVVLAMNSTAGQQTAAPRSFVRVFNLDAQPYNPTRNNAVPGRYPGPLYETK